MGVSLRVLIVEDSEDDALLLVYELKRAGYDPAFERVDTWNAMNEALEKEPWDLIICDYRMPHFSGLAAFKLYKEKGLDIPFIIVSGTIGNETAAGVMKAGAHDYVMKDKLARLIPSIKRKIQESEIRRKKRLADDVLKGSKNRYRSIFENATEGIFQTTTDGKIVDINPAMACIFGYSSREDMMMRFTDPGKQLFVNPEKRTEYGRLMKEQGRVEGFEGQFYKKDGAMIWCSISAHVVKDMHGNALYFEGIVEDISERSRAEKRFLKEMEWKNTLLFAYEKAPQMTDRELYDYFLEQAVRLTDSAIGFFHLVSDDGKSVVLTTWSGEALKNCTASYETHYPIDQVGSWVECIRLKRPVVYNDFPHSPNQKGLPEGHVPVLRFMSVPVIEEDEVRVIFGVGNKTEEYDEDDIIQIQVLAADLQTIIRQRRAEEAKSESEARYRSIFENAVEGIFQTTPEGRFIVVNPAMATMHGFASPEEMITSIRDADGQLFVNREDLEGYRKILEEQGSVNNFETQTYKNDGSVVWTSINCRAVKNASGEIVYFEGTAGDITGRKRAEETLLKSETRYKALFENANDAIFLVQGDIFVDCNTKTLEIFQCTRGQIIGQPPYRFSPSLQPDGRESREKALEKINAALEGIPQSFEWVHCHHDGTAFYAEVSLSALRLDDERFVQAIVRDITDNKRAEEALRKSEEKYRSIFENTVEGIFQVTPEGRFIAVNPAMARMHGFTSPEEMITSIRNIGAQLFVNREDRERYHKLLKERGSVDHFEAQMLRNGAAVMWTLINSRAVKNASGEILYFEGTAEDITHRKEAEVKLKEAFEFQQHLIDVLPVPVFYKDSEGRYLGCNNAYENFVGQKREMIIGKTVYDVARKECADIYHGWDLALIENPGVQTYESQVRAADGVVHDVIFHKATFPNRDGSIGGLIGAIVDITDRKLAESEAKVTMERLRKSLVGTIQAISLTVETRDPYTAGHQRRVSVLARAIAQEMGLSKETVDSIRMAGAIHDIGKMSVPAEILSRPTKLNDIEGRLITIHSQTGYDILKGAELPPPIAEIVLQHHERLDGSGYPQGLKDDQILLEAQILSVADVVEAIASHRPYRPAHGIDEALEEIENNKGKLYNTEVVDACIKLFREKGLKIE